MAGDTARSWSCPTVAGVSRSLTSDDLDALGADAVAAEDPRPVRAEILAAVEGGRIADPDEVPYALVLAAEISERCDEQADALALSTRAVAAAEGTETHASVRGNHADLLLRFGRGEEGMELLEELRPALTRDPGAVRHVIDPLVEHGRSELAEQWLTAALLTATERAERLDDDDEGSLEAWEVVDGLATRRRHVRGELGLPPDEHDELDAALDDMLDDTPDAIFWPEELLAAVIAAAPEGSGVEDATWDAHRATLERALQAAHADGEDLLVEVGTPEMAAALAEDGLDGVAPGRVLEWPPGRNDRCWCGSGAKYKKCCLPRARD